MPVQPYRAGAVQYDEKINPLAHRLPRPRYAQKEVARAYKRNEVQFDKAFVAAGDRANAAYAEALQKAARERALAEKAAEEAYHKALEQAKSAYESSVQQALKARDEAMLQTWNARKQAIDMAWKVFGKE